MKAVVCLLSALTLALSIMPCCVTCERGGTEAKQTDSNKSASKDGDGCGGDCSPFVACACCPGYTIPRHIGFCGPVSPQEPLVFDTAYQQPFLKDIILDIWQPPQLG